MNQIVTIFIICLCVGFSKPSAAQESSLVSSDSLKTVALSYINNSIPESTPWRYSSSDIGASIFIQDITTHIPLAEQRYGIYEFGQDSDDVIQWIMWYDATGYKIYEHRLNNDMLGDILKFCKRNKLSVNQSFRYIEDLYRVSARIEGWGEYEAEP